MKVLSVDIKSLALVFFFVGISVLFFHFSFQGSGYALPVPFDDLGLKFFFVKLFGLLAFACAFPSVLRTAPSLPQSPVALSVLAFLGILGASTAVSVDPSTSFWGSFDRQDGFLTFLFLFLWFVTSRVLLAEKRYEAAFLRILLIFGFLEVSIIIWQFIRSSFFGGELHEFGVRQPGTFGNPDFVAIGLIFLAVFAAFIIVRAREEVAAWRMGALLFLPLLIGALFLANSRGAFAGAALGMVYLFMKYRKHVPALVSSPVFRIAAAVFIIVLAAFLTFMDTARESFAPFVAHMFEGENVRTRILFWRAALSAVLERPLLGWGPENFTYAFDAHFPQGFAPTTAPGAVWSDFAHNAFLDSAVRAGIAGLAAFVGLFAIAARAVFRGVARGSFSSHEAHVLAAFLCAYAGSLFFLFNSFHTWVLFFLLLAYIDARSSRQGTPGQFASAARKSGVDALLQKFAPLKTTAAVFFAVVSITFIATAIPLLRATSFFALGKGAASLSEKALFFASSVAQSGPYSNFHGLAELEAAFADWQERNPVGIFAAPEGESIVLAAGRASDTELSRNPNALSWAVAGFVRETEALRTADTAALSRAAELFSEAYRRSPNREVIVWSLAEVSAGRGEYEKAQSLYEEAIALNPKRGEGYARLGLFLMARDEKERAASLLADAQRFGFSFTHGFITPLWFTDFYALRGEWKESAEFWKEVSAYEPENPLFLIYRAAAEYRSGDTALALSSAEKAVAFNPSLKTQVDFLKAGF